MDAGTRQKRVEGLEAIKDKAMSMAEEGVETLSKVQDFVAAAKKELAYELRREKRFKKLPRPWPHTNANRDNNNFLKI